MCCRSCNSFSENVQKEEGSFSKKQSCLIHAAVTLSGLALLIIHSLGAAQILQGAQFGWSSIAAASATSLVVLALGKWKDRKFTILALALAASIPILLGALTVAGILTAVQASWGILGPIVGVLAIGVFVCVVDASSKASDEKKI